MADYNIIAERTYAYEKLTEYCKAEYGKEKPIEAFKSYHGAKPNGEYDVAYYRKSGEIIFVSKSGTIKDDIGINKSDIGF